MSTPLYKVIEERAAQIVDRFVTRTREHELPPGPLSRVEVINHLNKYLADMARSLRRDTVDLVTECSSASEHGEQRWYLGYDLKSVIMEYSVLRDAILDVAEEAGHVLTARDCRDLGQFLNVGIADAAVEFADKSTQEIKAALRSAERATDVREEVVAIVSHDLKDPLQVIHTSVAMLIQDVADPDLNMKRASIERKLGAIRRASSQMSTLITDLLDLARIRAGSLPSDIQPVQVDDLLREAYEHAVTLAEQRSIRLEKQVLAGGSIVCNRARVLQVFANVLGNAIKFTKPNTTVSMRATCSNDECTFEIRDQGDGIPPERLRHLFDRFWRSSDAVPEGTGLGLAIAKAIVDQHQGRIWIESSSSGTACFFTLPTRPPGAGSST
jgi:signal transduction histidine kinase